jgi:hypothetical protein
MVQNNILNNKPATCSWLKISTHIIKEPLPPIQHLLQTALVMKVAWILLAAIQRTNALIRPQNYIIEKTNSIIL